MYLAMLELLIQYLYLLTHRVFKFVFFALCNTIFKNLYLLAAYRIFKFFAFRNTIF